MQSKWLKQSKLLGVLVDEVQDCSVELLASLTAGSDWFGAAGDVKQADMAMPNNVSLGGDLFAQSFVHCAPKTVLQGQNAMSWLLRCKGVQKFHMHGTHRIGPSLVRLVQQMWPGLHGNLHSLWPMDTLPVLVLFGAPGQADPVVYTADREAMLNTTVAAHLLQMVAAECVAMVSRPVHRQGKIVITAGLRSVVEAIQKVLQAGLSEAV